MDICGLVFEAYEDGCSSPLPGYAFNFMYSNIVTDRDLEIDWYGDCLEMFLEFMNMIPVEWFITVILKSRQGIELCVTCILLLLLARIIKGN